MRIPLPQTYVLYFSRKKNPAEVFLTSPPAGSGLPEAAGAVCLLRPLDPEPLPHLPPKCIHIKHIHFVLNYPDQFFDKHFLEDIGKRWPQYPKSDARMQKTNNIKSDKCFNKYETKATAVSIEFISLYSILKLGSVNS